MPRMNKPRQFRLVKANPEVWPAQIPSSPLPELRLQSEPLAFQMFHRLFQATSSVSLPSPIPSQQGPQERKINDYPRPSALGKVSFSTRSWLMVLPGPAGDLLRSPLE